MNWSRRWCEVRRGGAKLHSRCDEADGRHYPALKAVHPALIMCSISMAGKTDPGRKAGLRRDRPSICRGTDWSANRILVFPACGIADGCWAMSPPGWRQRCPLWSRLFIGCAPARVSISTLRCSTLTSTCMRWTRRHSCVQSIIPGAKARVPRSTRPASSVQMAVISVLTATGHQWPKFTERSGGRNWSMTRALRRCGRA